MLKLDHVKKEYPGFSLDCSLNVPEGYVTGLVGRNGAGKTTAFKAVLGLIQREGGSAVVLGKDSGKLTVPDREKLGVVLADSGFSGFLSIQDLLPVLSSLYHEFDKAFFQKKCVEFGLPLKKQIREFSTGMKRMLQVLAALSHNAKLLILDEPTAGMDVIAREELMELLREYMENGERSVLISSHISRDLEGTCDDIYMIDEGKIVFHEDTDKLLGQYGLLKMTSEQYKHLDKSYILRCRKEEFGYCCLTGEKQFYMENYPDLTVEKGNIDEMMMMMIRGDRL